MMQTIFSFFGDAFFIQESLVRLYENLLSWLDKQPLLSTMSFTHTDNLLGFQKILVLEPETLFRNTFFHHDGDEFNYVS